MPEGKSDALRLHMINGQLRTSDINERELLAAFAEVAREKFAAVAQPEFAYADGDINALGPPGRKLLSPRTLGLLLKTAAPVRGERALVVGGGAGYCSALLAKIGLEVVDLETDARAVRSLGLAGVECVEGRLEEPPAGKGPFDVIVVNGAFEVTPDRLLAALRDGGRLVGLRARNQAKRIVLFERFGAALSERDVYDAGAEVLPGFARPPAFSF